MPDKSAHRQRAVDNETFANQRLDMDEAGDRPWVATAYFYAALHWIEAYLASLPTPVHSRSHAHRKQFIAGDARLRPIQPQYRDLEDASRDARYELRAFSKTELRALYTNNLEPLRKYFEALIP